MPPERTSQSYGPGVTSASKAVLLEVMTTLRAYQDALVLVGGWVPSLLLQQHQRPEDSFVHVGSIDIDLAIDSTRIAETHYATIVELLSARGYHPVNDRRGTVIPGSLERRVHSPATKKPYVIRVDFLTSTTGAEDSRRFHGIQDGLLARKLKGCDAAFRYQTSIALTGTLPEGGHLTLPLRMADVVGALTMKGIVLGERYREKDAYDIYALMAHYGHGPREVAACLAPHVGDPLVAESLECIRTAFATRSAHGPAWVAAFLTQPLFDHERQRLTTDAWLTVQECLRGLHQPVSSGGLSS